MEIALLGIFTLLLIVQIGNIAYLRRPAAPPTGRRPFVSVLIPARNEAANLRRLIPSLLDQTCGDFEVLVYDDASEDETWAVLQSFDDPRLRTLRGTGPPEGWVGKVHALFQAAKEARGDVYVFLDADAELLDDGALGRLVDRFRTLAPRQVLTGFTDLRGGGLLLVSLVPHTILTFLPWFLVEHVRSTSLGSVNGQCWLIDAETYHALAPHEHVRNEVLEDVAIGRYLKGEGVDPVMTDVRRELAVYMYDSFGDAWRGFRKNAYLLMGGRWWTFTLWWIAYAWMFAIAPFVWPEVLAAVYCLKIVSDRAAGMPIRVTILGPLAHIAGVGLHVDSAVSHWTGRARWKGRRVGYSNPASRSLSKSRGNQGE
ncbi:MAG: glycosyltransferase family 2 protein [Rhodothermales bacterium]